MASIMKQAKRAQESATTCENNNAVAQLWLVYRRYAARVYTLCLQLLPDIGSAEAATADVFVRFNRILARWQDESRTPECLRELAIEAALARLQERNSTAEPMPDEVGLLSGSLANSNRAVRLDPVRLEGLIARLPDRLRVPYVLRDVEGLSDSDIATRLRFDKAEVRRRVHRARLELRRLWLG